MSFRTHARTQAQACAALDSPFMARVLMLVADCLRPGHPVADRLLDWPEERLKPDAVALRLTGALHHLVLTAQAPILTRVYAARDTVDDAQLWRVIDAALRLNPDAILATLARAPQTNELQRATVYIAAAHWLSAAFDLPLVMSELGSSAGINLLWDRYALRINDQTYGPPDAAITLAPDWHGHAPPHAPPLVRSRAGVDMHPLDPVSDKSRLLSYIWADQRDRLARTACALDIVAQHRPEITRGHALDWLDARLARPIPQAVHLVCHTITWQYFSAVDQARGEAIMARAGARCRTDEPLAHLAMEDDGAGPGAALSLHLWPEDARVALGRMDFHGRWVDWRAPAP